MKKDFVPSNIFTKDDGYYVYLRPSHVCFKYKKEIKKLLIQIKEVINTQVISKAKNFNLPVIVDIYFNSDKEEQGIFRIKDGKIITDDLIHHGGMRTTQFSKEAKFLTIYMNKKN